jgi:nucleoside-diphosphate kinase
MERTLIIFKPEALKRALCGTILRKFERKGYILAACKMLIGSKREFEEHYAEHRGKSFFDELTTRMTVGPCLFLVMQGPTVVEWSRKLIGATDPNNAAIGTIRGDYATSLTQNLIHASDSVASANREIALWFGLI